MHAIGSKKVCSDLNIIPEKRANRYEEAQMSLYYLYNNILSKTFGCCGDDEGGLFGWVRTVIL